MKRIADKDLRIPGFKGLRVLSFNGSSMIHYSSFGEKGVPKSLFRVLKLEDDRMESGWASP